MTTVDQFESVFRAAAKPAYRHESIEIGRILVVTDLEKGLAAAFGDRVRRFLRVLETDPPPAWRIVDGSEFRGIGGLLELVRQESPDLICTYRHLHSEAWRWPHSLGEELDVLTQINSQPVLVLPHPESGRETDHALENTDSVMAVTDHLTGDDRLVNYAVKFLKAKGQLFLAHIEDEAIFERYIETISKIPEIDTETAREEISKRLLDEPADYIESCVKVLREIIGPGHVSDIVAMGRRLADYRSFVEGHRLDLLIFNTKQEEQLAMHGLAYPLAVELRQIPLLML